jgi:nickel/cobalt transporter (NicO) family protein
VRALTNAHAGATRRRALLCSVVVGGVLLALQGSASGHAAGMPPHASLHADGSTIHVELTSAADDAALIGSSLGLLPEGSMEWYLGETHDGPPSDEEIRAFSASPDLRDYLLEHVEVRQDGVTCAGQAEPAEDFVLDGAELRFTCPEPVEEVDLRITILHDQDPAYRTYSVDGTIQSYTHTSAQPEHRWDFTLAGADAPAVPAGLWLGLGLVGLSALGLLGWWRRSSSAGRSR